MESAPIEAPASTAYDAATEGGDEWHDARNRVLLYLRALGMPPIMSLATALDVLRRAVPECEKSAGCPPVRRAMQALCDVMAERQLDPHTRTFWDCGAALCAGENASIGRSTAGADRKAIFHTDLPVMPPLNRGHMLPDLIDRKPVRSFLAKLFRRKTPSSNRPAPKRTPTDACPKERRRSTAGGSK
jgi:hypothetical protein